MRIGLIGWYGHQNAGDDRILYCLKRFFCDHQIISTSGLDDALKNIEILNKCDFVLFGGGGLVLRGWNKFVPLIEQIKPRFGCVGISVEAKNRDNSRFIDTMLAKAEFVLVRDQQSKELLDNHFKVILGPDLTFLYPFEIVNEVEEETCGLNLRPWYYWQCEHGGTYYRLMNSINSNFPGFNKIYPFAKWQPKHALDIVKSNFPSVIPVPFYTEENQINDLTLLSGLFRNYEVSQYNPALYGTCRYFVGMRLHSLIFACQMGIPFVSLSYQPKNVEFCKSIGTENLSVGLFELGKLIETVDYMKEFYSDIRNKMLENRDKSNKEIWHIMNSVKRLIVKEGS